jgi:large subunit ribosomal protein L6
MSRIGKKPIIIPSGVSVEISGQKVIVKGPKGSLEQIIHETAKASLIDNQLLVTVNDENNVKERALWGLTRSLLANLVIGVTVGFQKSLEINGVGFKATTSGQTLVLNLGFSHPVNFPIPKGITITVEKNVITVSGIDCQQVGQVAAEIRALKKPEPYKGKGIKYSDEIIRRKAGKVVKSAA